MSIKWSEQQSTFLDWCKNGEGSCVLEAVAGAGKTTTLIAAAELISGSGAIMAYNRKIADEIKNKLQKAGVSWMKANANTVHGFGMGAYRKARPKVRVVEYKMADIFETMFDKRNPVPVNQDLAVFIPSMLKLTSLAKQKVFGLVSSMNDLNEWYQLADHFDVFDDDDESGPVPQEEIFQLCITALNKSIDQLDLVDFDDMIYMPLIHKVRFWQQDWIMVDEAQDTNRARRALIRAMLKKGGRVIAVGDRHQAIYGFTGADADALDLIARDFSCIRLPLTVTFRCPKTVVDFSHKWVSHITAAPEAPIGSVSRCTMEEFIARNDLNSGSAVLSRVTKPLVALAFHLIQLRKPCRIEGRDVANRIKKLMTRWKLKTLDQLEERLETYLFQETTKLLAKKQETKMAEVEDAVETIRTIIDQCRREKKHSIDDAVAYVDSIFGDNVSDVMVLSTIHKAKGREWPRVFWLDRAGTCPSKWARQAWQKEQEGNLCYVAATRAQEALIELDPPVKKAA